MAKDYAAAMGFVTREKKQIDDATLYLREQIKRARRNYESKYDEPVDPITKKRKMFIPLTKQEVDTIAARFSLPADAITVKTNEPGLYRKAIIWEELLKAQFEKMEWEERTREGMIPFVNEGNFVIEMFWNNEKKNPDFRIHDLKDVYLFPKEQSFEEASGFAIRKRVLWSDFENDPDYANKDEVRGNMIVQDDPQNGTSQTMQYEIGKYMYKTELDFVELYERNGFFPRSLITGNEKHKDLVDGIITTAWVDKSPVVVKIDEKSNRANYIESWYNKRSYVWYATGVGIALRDYQFYYNKIVNRRDNNEDVLHHGMFVKRRGMNIDARQKMTGAGIWIEADNPAEITQLRTQDITGPSYTGENNLLAGVQRLDGTYDVVKGGGNSSSASEAAIKDRNAGTRLDKPMASLNRMFCKAVKRAMELDKEYLPKNTVVKMTGRDEELAMFDDFKLKEVNKARAEEGLAPISDAEFKTAMAQFKGERFINVPSMKFLSGDFEPEIDSDASLIKTKSGQSNFIVDAMKIAAQVPGVPQTIDFADLFEKLMDLNGLKVKRLPTPPPPPPGAPSSGGISGGAQSPNAALQEMANAALAGSGTPQAANNAVQV